jgi:hypothetical protein
MTIRRFHMAQKKSAPKKSESKPAKAKAKTVAKKRPESKKQEEEMEPCGCEVVEEVHEHGDECGCGCNDATEELFGRNAQRSYALKDLWYESLSEVVDEQIAPESNKREMMFLTLSNAMLDMMMDILPEDVGVILAQNMDDYLAVTLVNKKYDVDVLKAFQEEFVEKNGANFDDEEILQKALDEFQDKFWTTGRKDLKGRSPNEAVEEALKKYDLV